MEASAALLEVERDQARAEVRRLSAELGEARREIERLRALVPSEAAVASRTRGGGGAEVAEAALEDGGGDGEAPGDPRLELHGNATSGDVCALCNRHGGTPSGDFDEGTLEGDLVFPPFRGRKGEAVWCHERCLLYSAEVHGSSGGELHNVLAAVKRGRSLKCFGCKERGATVGCGVPSCRMNFHLRCAAAHGELFDPSEETAFLCAKHRDAGKLEAVQCERCLKWRAWRKLDAVSGRPAAIPEGHWFCEDNEDLSFASCAVPAEPSMRAPGARQPDARGAAAAPRPPDEACALCGLPGDDPRVAGWTWLDPPLLKDGALQFVHDRCLALAPEVTRSGGHVRGRTRARRRPTSNHSSLGRVPPVSAEFSTSDRPSKESRSVNVYSGTRARGTSTVEATLNHPVPAQATSSTASRRSGAAARSSAPTAPGAARPSAAVSPSASAATTRPAPPTIPAASSTRPPTATRTAARARSTASTTATSARSAGSCATSAAPGASGRGPSRRRRASRTSTRRSP